MKAILLGDRIITVNGNYRGRNDKFFHVGCYVDAHGVPIYPDIGDTGESGETYEAEMGACERCKGAPAVNAALCQNCFSELKVVVLA